ncbi:hypothetical protein Ahy_B01g052760 [Arachis hypogaea]|uniref:Uncharacterized protein n=1 Tax=Arachis hypogaea TaxID=3818 RepID=A0A445AQD2_ARAHY|nr:hypothetical protein Ahy_B01g052760 [Arachis hypogaea]
MDEIRKIYQHEFVPVGHPSKWSADTEPQLISNSALRRGGKGRPKSTRYLNEMDIRQMRGPRQCNFCREESHSRSRCPHCLGSSSGGTTIIVKR